MRVIGLVLAGALIGGCASSRWQVVPAGSETILLDQTTGNTWSRSYYQRPGDKFFTPYWVEMPRGQATTRPATTAAARFDVERGESDSD